MEKQIITFSANEQTLTKTGGIDCYASNTVAYIEARFDLGDNWSGYDSVRAVWWNDYNKTVATVLDSAGTCIVPYEVLTRKGAVKVNLVGSITDGDVLTDRLTTCPVIALTIKCNAKTDGDNTQPITPSEYEQFVQTVKADADRAEAGAESAEASAQSASESATASANSATSSAQSATASAQSEQNASESAQSAENAKDDAEDARDKILGMRATATTLEAGSDATASYDNGLLTLGIPRGDKGAKGDTGDTGATPNLTIGTVETLAPTEDATATITGTAEEPVLNLGLPKGDTGEVSLEDLEALLPTDTASGDIVTIPDGQSVIPAESLKVELEPIQSGSGTPSPDNVRPISGRTEVVTQRTGKNLFDKDNVNELDAYIANDKVTTNLNHRCVYIPCEPNTTYTVQKICVGSGDQDRFSVGYTAETPSNDVTCYGIIHSTTTSRVQGQMVSLSITTGSDAEYLICWISYSTGYANSIATFQLELGSTATAYEPYQGTTYTTDLGRTVYGGTLDVVSGELVVDRAMVDLGSLNWSYASTVTYPRFATTAPITGAKGATSDSTVANAICSTYAHASINTIARGQGDMILALSGAGYVWVRDSSKTGLTSFTEAITGQTLCYELATPQTIQLTPQEIKLLLGNNNVWSDGGVTLVYNADIQLWVEKKLS